ncbi:MAG: hypothetical protein FWG34_07955 [Oscillospiraceae bacterium]|nr:hypothetical protein [Oscillospiraceae bacterium]
MMEFYTASKTKRPVRLSETTRDFAKKSLSGHYGSETMETPFVKMDEIENFEDFSDYKKYDAIIQQIAEQAPLRICPEELISGAATLGGAIGHVVPAQHMGKYVFGSVSHLTLGFEYAVKNGVERMRENIKNQIEKFCDPYKIKVLESMQNTIGALKTWHSRYLSETKIKKPKIYKNLLQVPFGPARNFYEAVQSLWFLFAFTRLTGNWSGIGRLDVILGEYLENDLKRGFLSMDRAREILASFFIKGCEWIQQDTPKGSGDAQHYQNIVLSGVDGNGKEITNAATYLALEIIEELPIGDFPIAVRISGKTPAKLLRKMAETIRHGGGIVAVYNDDLIIKALTDFGYGLEEARCYANDGCWEVQIPGKTNFSYYPFDSLYILQRDTLKLEGEPANYCSFEELYAQFAKDLSSYVKNLCSDIISWYINPENKDWKKKMPCSVISLFTEGCVENGSPYYEGGPKYTVVSPHIGGLADTANSLYAIKKFVFEEKSMPFQKFLSILQNNWEGEEKLRLSMQNRYVYFGNDNDEADGIAAQIVDDFAKAAKNANKGEFVLTPPGISTFGRQIEWQWIRTASAHGYKKGDVLAGNFSPTPGTDQNGATAIIKSHCKTDLSKMTTGASLDLKLFPTIGEGERGIEAITNLITGFVNLGGFFMNIDLIDDKILLDAKRHPENYKSLSVRISGWSARFVTLDEKWQNMVIGRMAQGM